MKFIQVRDWEKLQHYKKRNPPWIRVYNEILEDYDFAALPDASKWHLVGIWLLASRLANRIPADAAWIGQRIGARSPVDLDALLRIGAIQPAPDQGESEGVLPMRATR